MFIFSIIGVLLAVIYFALMIIYRAGWRKTEPFLAKAQQPVTRFSIVVPARNEAENIGTLLQQLTKIDYPKELFEIIVADDHSQDGTAAIVQKFGWVKLLTMPANKQGKKMALTEAIKGSAGDYIIQTDADCSVQPQWLRVINDYIQKTQKQFIVMPVLMNSDGEWFSKFQSLDFMMLQGVTAAGLQQKLHFMCNGANLCYSRQLFSEVNGFKGNLQMASGDDMFLMQKAAAQQPGKIGYLLHRDVTVITKPQKDFKSFISQRARWAGKSSALTGGIIKPVMLLVYALNVYILVSAILNIFYPSAINALLLLAAFILKVAGEGLLILPVGSFYGLKNVLANHILFQPLHIFYTVLSGAFSFIRKNTWKGRPI